MGNIHSKYPRCYTSYITEMLMQLSKKHLDDINKDNVAHIPMHQYQFNHYNPEG